MQLPSKRLQASNRGIVFFLQVIHTMEIVKQDAERIGEEVRDVRVLNDLFSSCYHLKS